TGDNRFVAISLLASAIVRNGGTSPFIVCVVRSCAAPASRPAAWAPLCPSPWPSLWPSASPSAFLPPSSLPSSQPDACGAGLVRPSPRPGPPERCVDRPAVSAGTRSPDHPPTADRAECPRPVPPVAATPAPGQRPGQDSASARLGRAEAASPRG